MIDPINAPHFTTARRDALALYRWLLEQPDAKASETAMLRIGPRATRSRDRRDIALSTLEQAALVSCFGRVWCAERPNRTQYARLLRIC